MQKALIAMNNRAKNCYHCKGPETSQHIFLHF